MVDRVDMAQPCNLGNVSGRGDVNERVRCELHISLLCNPARFYMSKYGWDIQFLQWSCSPTTYKLLTHRPYDPAVDSTVGDGTSLRRDTS
jgi:hypothetical protein